LWSTQRKSTSNFIVRDFRSLARTTSSLRFRVVIPFEEAISPDDYSLLYENIIAKIRDEGYSVGQRNGTRRSGLDVTKKTPTSLFYLLCQSQDPTQSFFNDYNDDKRQILDPYKWIENSIVAFPKKLHLHRPQQPQPRTIDQAKVEDQRTDGVSPHLEQVMTGFSGMCCP
jgi:hypothetical protein